MKELRICILIFFVWYLPVKTSSSVTNQESKTSKELGVKFINAWNQHNPDDLISLFTDDCTYEEVCSGRKYFGKSEIRVYAGKTIVGMPDSKFEVINVIAVEHHVSVEWTWQGTNSVGWPYMGINPTNKTIKIKGVSFMDVENGKIKNVRDYWDWKSFINGIGVNE